MTKLEVAHNIAQTVTNDLCIGCGFCVASCPEGAIKISRTSEGFFIPKITANICIECGACSNICPGLGIKTQKLFNSLTSTSYNELLGQYLTTYTGYANDFATRYRGSSGGIITALSLYLLQKGIVDGVVVVTMDSENPLNAIATIATCEADVLHANGSKYTPVSMHKVMQQILSNKDKKFVFIGLPCHLAALSNLEKKVTNLKSLIFLKIGLYCYNTPSMDATRYILDRLKVSEGELIAIRYRGNGWPGNLAITLQKNQMITSAFTKYSNTGFLQYFCKKRCILCADQTSESADISVGDPWTIYPEIVNVDSNQTIGDSVLLVRTPVGQKALDDAVQAGFITLNPLDPKKTVQSTTMLKKRNKHSRSVKFLLGVKSLPYQEYSLPLNLNTTMWLLRYRFNSFLAKNKKRWPLLRASVMMSAFTGSLIACMKRSVLRRR